MGGKGRATKGLLPDVSMRFFIRLRTCARPEAACPGMLFWLQHEYFGEAVTDVWCATCGSNQDFVSLGGSDIGGVLIVSSSTVLDFSFHLDNDLAFGSPLSQIVKCLFGLLKRKYFVDHWSNTFRCEQLANFRQLRAIGTDEQK